MTRHYAKLRSYVQDVALDMIARGTIDRARNQSTLDVIRTHAMAIGVELLGDVEQLGREFGVRLVVGGEHMLDAAAHHAATAFAGGIKSTIADLLRPKRSR